MKLAREIADDIYKEVLMTSEELCAVEHIIAAKLMPVRDAIQFVLDDSKEEWSGTMLTNKTDKALCEILDMLSDEEK